MDQVCSLLLCLLLWRLLPGCHGDACHAKSSALWWLLSVSLQVHNVPSGSVFSSLGLVYGLTTATMVSGTSPIVAADLTISKTVQPVSNQTKVTFPYKVRFSSLVSHTTSSSLDAINVTLTDGSNYFDVHFGEGFIGPPMNDPNFVVTGNKLMSWSQSSLLMADTMHLSYVANANKDLPDGETQLSSRVTYRHYVGGPLVTIDDMVCVNKKVKVVENVVYQYGFVVLGLVVGLIVGALIVILILFIIYKVRRKTPFDTGVVRPATVMDTQAVNRVTKSTVLITDAKVSMKKGFQGLYNWGQGVYNGSIVFMLSIKDKLKAFRVIDDMDIGGTAHVDQQLESERNSAMMDATRMLLHSLEKNGDIPSGVNSKALSNFQKKADKLDKDLNDDFRKDMEALLRTISLKNKEKLGDLLDKQEEERDSLEEKTKHLNKEEKEELKQLLLKQQETERSEVNHQLELEQKEQLEKLRKERAIRKRMATKGLQQELLDDVKEQAKLSPEQADWLMKEHFKNQAAVERLYDEEISRQRMILEEKLALRRALADNKESQEDADSEVLNQLAEQQISLILKAKKSDVMSKQEANALIDEIQKDILNAKELMEQERHKQEEILHKKLSERKKNRMEELLKKQKQEVTALDKSHAQTQTGTGYADPMANLQQRQSMLSQHRAELTELENTIDREDVVEYGELRNKYFHQLKGDLNIKKDDLVKNLEGQGMSDSAMRKIIEKHNREQDDLAAKQAEWQKDQAERLKQQLSERRSQWQQRRLEETVEQDNLREHEDNVIRKLMDNQVALSESERERILQEHEKQMVTIENSLTLSKLQQQRMLEEKLARKRTQQLEKLQKKHTKESKKLARDDDEEEGAEIDMLKRQAEDRIAVLRGETIRIDDEIDEIRGAMLKERANALKEQEIKLGAMLAQLQMDKAKEMSRIEEQQKAIYNLKTSLMDDLNEKGMLSDPDCQKVIKIHQKEQEKLNQKLDAQRAKQEKALKDRLSARLRQKEKQLEHSQQQELKDASRKMTGSSAAVKLRQAALATRHMMDMEKFRNHMENEIGQSVQELKRKNEIRRIEALQDQEIQFINGLVRLGKFRPEELKSVLKMLFPNKSEAEHKVLLEKMLEGIELEKKGKKPQGGEDVTGFEPSSLEQRVLANTLANVDHQTTTGSLKAYGQLFKALSLKRNDKTKVSPQRRMSSRSSSAASLTPVASSDLKSIPHHRSSQASKAKMDAESIESDDTLDVGQRSVQRRHSSARRRSSVKQSGRSSDEKGAFEQRRSSTRNRSWIEDEVTGQAVSDTELVGGDVRKKLKKRGVSTMDDYEMRPDPIGRHSPDGYDDRYGNERPSRTLPSKLPPLERPKQKKKKKVPTATLR